MTGVSVGALLVTVTGVGVFTASGLSVLSLVVLPFVVVEALLLVPPLHAMQAAASTVTVLKMITLRISVFPSKIPSIIKLLLMDKTAREQLHRLFLVERLPE